MLDIGYAQSQLDIMILATAVALFLLDHSVRPVEHRRRNREADLLRGLQVDHQIELHRLLHGKVSRLGAFQNPIDIARGVSTFGDITGSVRHHATVVHIIFPRTHRRQAPFDREVRDRFLIRIGYWIQGHGDGIATRPNRILERALVFIGAAHLHRIELQT